MLFCKNIIKAFGTQNLFSGADFQLNKRERIGVVGRNGSGKSTLLHLIEGTDTVDDGEISYPENYRIGSLEQNLKFTQGTILAEVAQSLDSEKHYDLWKAEKLLAGLGFAREDFLRSADTFSGGFQIRVKLAQLLLSEPDLLLLDEPTNYLDITSIRWLESFLRQWRGELLCVSHDQAFLENICTHTALIHREKIKKLKGPPQKIYAQVENEEVIHEKNRQSQAKEQSRQEKFIREFRAGARSAGLVQSRIKMLEKKETLKALPPLPPIKFHFPEYEFTGTKVIEGHNLSFGYKPDQDLFRKLTFEIFPGEKIAIIGANGKGKTTLLRVLAQQLEIHSGSLKHSLNIRQGYFGQSNIDKLDPQKNIIEEIASTGHVTEQKAQTIAGSLLFSGTRAYKKTQVLSGGEKARVNLGKLLAQHTNLLLLDEPTNHLDYESVEALIKSLQEYGGTIIFVSHNERLLREVAGKLIVFDEDSVTVFRGGYDQFLAEKGFSLENLENPTTTGNEKKKDSTKSTSPRAGKEQEKLLRPLKNKFKRIEKEIAGLEKLQKENKEHFSAAYLQGNILKMDTLGIEYQKLQENLEAKLLEWESVGKQIEEVEKQESLS